MLFFLGLCLCQLPFESDSFIAQFSVLHIDGSLVPTVKPFLEICHVLVELVEIDIGKNGTNDAALRSAAVTLMQLVIFHISCVEKFTDKAQKTLVLNPLAKNADHDIMVDIVEEAFNISLNKPLTSGEDIVTEPQLQELLNMEMNLMASTQAHFKE